MSEPETTKDKILRTTFLLLLEKGYDGVIISDIQNALGISRGLLYRYFKNKNELVFAACREYFYDRYFNDADYDTMSLRDFIDHTCKAIHSITNFYGNEIEMLKYNTLYSTFIQKDADFKLIALMEFDKARKVIRNAIARKEIKCLPENFIGATILAILGRTSYITPSPTNKYIIGRILEDVEQFYNLIKS